MYRIFIAVVCLLFVSGCGIQQATEDTKNLVKDSNVIQKDILAGIGSTLVATKEMKDPVHLQIMTLALRI